MIINNINIKEFGGKVQSKSFSDSPIVKSATWLLYAPKPLVIGENKGFKSLNIKILFEGSNRNEINNKISSFMAQVSECDIKFNNLEHYYHCYYESSDREESGIDEWLFVNLNFICYEYAEEKTFNVSALETFTLNNNGTDITPVIVEITPNLNMGELEIVGLSDSPILIKNLAQNKKIIIDGEEQLITIDGSNAFEKYDAWEYPRLLPGVNKITLSKKNLNLNIIYKERFI
ncbi:phage tail domain-containing protein [uncultured Clostridium sp.]|uniref:phage distal tail protein n=1 Tax=uncultured Clostridium sp. TaxID=59620 RepID=UPI002730026B|nr:phage tail domain-containing protein [uncultured Clostridium sp.]